MDTHIIETREFEWKVHNCTKDGLKGSIDFVSDDFYIFLDHNETKWHFLMQIRESNIGIYLNMIDSETDDYAVKCEIFTRKLNNEKKNTWSFLKTYNEYKKVGICSFDWGSILSAEDINKKNSNEFLQDDALTTLTFGLKVELTKKKEFGTAKGTTDNPYQTMCKEYFATKSYSDFKFVCSDGIEIPVHRFVLAGVSPVMKTLFDTKVTQLKNNIVNIKDIDGETMTEILRFIYTQEVNDIKDFAENLLYGAQKYELKKLKNLCVAALIENLSVENALEYFLLADKYDSRVLLERSAMFIKSHHKVLFKDGKNLNKLAKKYLILLLECYQQNPGEVQTFESTFHV